MTNITKWQRAIFPFIISVCIIVPLTNDLYISGLPEMAHYFGGSNVSLVLSMSLLGIACAQPFYGPLLDRFGRRPILIAGLLIFTIASALVMQAHDFSLLLAGRFLQAIGGCSTLTSAMAMVRDKYKQEELVKATGFIMAIVGIGPAAAPLLGSFLNITGWRTSFIFLFGLGCFYLLLISLFLQETLATKNMQALMPKKIISNYYTLFKNKKFLSFCITSGFSYGIFFSYICLSPYFIMERLKYSLISFGVIVAINAVGILITAIYVPRLAQRFSINTLIATGLSIITLGGLLMWLFSLCYGETIYTLMLPMFITTIGVGFIRPMASAGALQLIDSSIAGSAAAFFNLYSFVSSTLAVTVSTAIISYVSDFGLFIGIMGCAALLALNIAPFTKRVIRVIKGPQFEAQ